MTLCMLAHHFLVRLQQQFKKTLHLTLPQVVLLLSMVLPRPAVDFGTVIAILKYRILRNEAAYQSHRRRRIKQLAPESVPTCRLDISL
jgi:hypothetical protein